MLLRYVVPILLLSIAPVWAEERPVRREAIEWCDAWMSHLNERDLPRVVLIGDSITRGYYPAVEQNLAGKAYVARITTSKAIGDPALLAELATFLTQVRFDVVHFNVGMHGWAYSEDEYKEHFPALVAAIRKAAPEAKLIWASTTPVRKDRPSGASNERIEARNRIARAYAESQAIPVNDLNGLMSTRGDMHTDDVHFSKEGSAIMAGQVAAEVSKALAAK